MSFQLPEVKLTNIFKVPEVPKKPVLEEKPAVPVPKKVESPPPEGTYKTMSELATCAISNLSLVPLFFLT